MALYEPGFDKSGGAGVVCYMGKKCPCVFGGNLGDNIFVFPGECKVLDDIMKAHESKHFGDVDCSKGCHLHRPDWKPNILKPDQILIECMHRRASVEDLATAIADPATPEICRIKMAKLKANLEAEMNHPKINCDERLKAQDLIDAIK